MRSKIINILHVTPHLGGGVGRILSSISINSNKEYKHSILVLEETRCDNFKILCIKNGIDVFEYNRCNVDNIILDCDILQLEWWHHPLTMKFMIDKLQNIPVRLFVWSHISGIDYPSISYKFIKYADIFAFTTKYSLESLHWTDNEKNYILNNTKTILSSALDESFNSHKDFNVKETKYKTFNVGYIGFLGYTKMNKDFVKYCEMISDIKNIKYIVIGDLEHSKNLIRDIEKSKLIKDKIEIMGYVNDVREYLSQFDIFLYILDKNHYGTTENILLEAMAMGVVPIVLNQCAEKYLVKHMETGIIINDIYECKYYVNWLYENPDELNRISKKSSEFAIKNYNIKNTIKKLNNVYNYLLKKDKTIHNAEKIFGTSSYEWFKSCYFGNINNLKGCAISETKGSAKHYLKYFYDEKLKEVITRNESRK